MSKPRAITISVWTVIAEICLCVAFVVAALITERVKAESGFWFGLQSALARFGGAASLAEFDAYHSGAIFGLVVFQLLFLSGLLWALLKRRFVWSLVFVLLLSVFSRPLAIIPLVLILIPSGRRWLMNRPDAP